MWQDVMMDGPLFEQMLREEVGNVKIKFLIYGQNSFSSRLAYALGSSVSICLSEFASEVCVELFFVMGCPHEKSNDVI